MSEFDLQDKILLLAMMSSGVIRAAIVDCSMFLKSQQRTEINVKKAKVHIKWKKKCMNFNIFQNKKIGKMKI